MAAKKELKNKLKLQIMGGQANPAPPLGPILGQNGINMQAFTQEFNDKTRDMMGEEIPVEVEVYKDNSFKMKIKRPTVIGMIKKTINLKKGSSTPNKTKVGSISMAQIKEIAARKMPDLNTSDLEAAERIVAGSAKSLGLEIK